MTGGAEGAGTGARRATRSSGAWHTSLACGLCTDRLGRPSSDGGARRPGLGLSWSTANTTVHTLGQCLLIDGPVRGQVRHRHLQLDAHRRPQRSLPALGHDPGPIHAGLQNLAGLSARYVARAH